MNTSASSKTLAESTDRSATDQSGFVRERAVPSILLTLTTTVLVYVSTLPPSNTDTYFHLRFGHEFLGDWSLRDPGSVSSFATARWVPTQWLPEMVMAKTEDLFGLAGVAWLSGLQLVGLALTLYLVARRWGTRAWVATLVPLSLAASYLSLSMRPQVISYILIVVTLGAWLRTRDDGRLRWWLVPVTWLWAMCHGMWPVGIGLGCVALVGLGLDRVLPRRDLARGALIPVLSAVAAALTPVGPELYAQIMRVQHRAQFFTEWGRPDPASFSWIVLAVLALAGVALLLRARPFSWLEGLLLGVCLVCSWWSWRTVPVAAFLLVPLLASLSQGRAERVSRAERRVVLGGALAAVAALACCVPFTATAPASALLAVDKAAASLSPGTKVVDAWDWGGYLMWRDPRLDLLMHGYGDTYTVAELQRDTVIDEVKPGWEADLKATGCEIAILRPSSDLAKALLAAHWQVVLRNVDVIELRAPSGWS